MDIAAGRNPRLILVDDEGCPRKALRLARQLKNNARTKVIPILMMLPIDTFKHARSKIRPYVEMCIPKTFTASVLVASLQSLLSS